MGAILLACAGVVAWVVTMQSAARTLSFEPNSAQAINASAAARTPALAWGAGLVAAAVALAFVTGHRWLVLLGVPGLVVAVFVFLAPGANGGALLWGLASSVVVTGVTFYLEGRRRMAGRSPAARRP